MKALRIGSAAALAALIVLAGAAYLAAVLGRRLFRAGRAKNAVEDPPQR